jgi:hypothetical protein
LVYKRACELKKSHVISTDEDPGLRIESFAVINLIFSQTKYYNLKFAVFQEAKSIKFSHSSLVRREGTLFVLARMQVNC